MTKSSLTPSRLRSGSKRSGISFLWYFYKCAMPLKKTKAFIYCWLFYISIYGICNKLPYLTLSRRTGHSACCMLFVKIKIFNTYYIIILRNELSNKLVVFLHTTGVVKASHPLIPKSSVIYIDSQAYIVKRITWQTADHVTTCGTSVCRFSRDPQFVMWSAWLCMLDYQYYAWLWDKSISARGEIGTLWGMGFRGRDPKRV